MHASLKKFCYSAHARYNIPEYDKQLLPDVMLNVEYFQNKQMPVQFT